MKGGGESFNTYTVSGWCEPVVTLPVWVSLGIEYQKAILGGAGREFFYTAEKEGGRGIVGRPLPTQRESRALLVTPGHQRLLVYTRAPTSAVWIRSSASSCLY